MSRFGLRWAAALALAGIMALGACSAQPSYTASPTRPSKSPAPRTAFTVALGMEITNLSVNQEAGIANFYLAALTQESLLATDETGALIPALAESWRVEENKWIFQIRQGVEFQNGTPLTVEDILFSLEVAGDPKKSPGLKDYWPSEVQSIEQTGPWEITITLDSPHSTFGTAVTVGGGLLITSKAFYENAAYVGSSADLLIGTGPYLVTDFDTTGVTLVRMDSYWGGAHGPRQVRLDFIIDDAKRLAALQNGTADVALPVPISKADSWDEEPDVDVTFYSDRSYQGLTMDASVAPFDDIHVRRAVAYCVDKQGIVDNVLKGHGQVATSIESPDQMLALSDQHTPELLESMPNLEYSPTLALEELEQSRAPTGFPVTLTWPTGYPDVSQASNTVARCLNGIGIKTTVEERPLQEWLGQIGDGKQGLAWMVYSPTTSIPWEASSWLLAAEGPGANPANWTHEEVAAKMSTLDVTNDPAEQLDILMSSTKQALEEIVYVPIYWGEAAIATRSGVAAADFNSYTLMTNWVTDFKIDG
jgi:peptide/nickel transport system substrate-binding protein